MKYLSIITLFLLSITITSIHAADNTQYKTWYKSPVSEKIKEGSDDDQLAKLERELTGLHTASFSRKTITSKEFMDEWNEKYKNSWEELLKNIQKFIEKKHKKLTPTIEQLANLLRTLVANIEKFIKNLDLGIIEKGVSDFKNPKFLQHASKTDISQVEGFLNDARKLLESSKFEFSKTEAQATLNKSAEKFPKLFTEINTSGISTFQSTKMARELAGTLALTLELTYNHAIKNLNQIHDILMKDIKEIEQSVHKPL
jgi:hypothetical protein